MNTYIATNNSFWIAHTNGQNVVYGEIDTGQRVDTGQAILEIFETENLWTARLNELGINLNNEEEIIE